MARFIGKVQGGRGEAFRVGSAKSGMSGALNGWDVGLGLFASVDDEGRDFLTAHVTGGSNNSKTYGSVDARQVGGTDVLVSVDEELLSNCDPDALAATIMLVPALVTKLRGLIFIEGKADGG